jgi:Leucine-rich repeat (LRR) protein
MYRIVAGWLVCFSVLVVCSSETSGSNEPASLKSYLAAGARALVRLGDGDVVSLDSSAEVPQQPFELLTLDVEETQLRIIPDIEKATALYAVTINVKQLDSEAIRHLGRLRSLESLTICGGTAMVRKSLDLTEPALEIKEAVLAGVTIGPGLIGWLARGRRLESLTIGDSALGDVTLAELRPVTKLNHLQLVNVSGMDVHAIPAIPTLRVLCLQGKPLDGNAIADIQKFEGLEDVHVVCRVQGEDLAPLLTLKNLKILDLSRSELSDEAIAPLGAAMALVDVDLTACKVGDDAASYLSLIKTLEGIGLTHTNVTQVGIAAFQKLPNLKRLSVQATKVLVADFETISKLRSLEDLNCRLIQGVVRDANVQHIVKLARLKNLALGECELTAVGVRELSTLRALQHLALTQPLDDSIAGAFGSFGRLQHLWIELPVPQEAKSIELLVARISAMLPECDVRITNSIRMN